AGRHQVGDGLGGDGGQQDAVAEVTGGQDQAAHGGGAQHRQVVLGVRSEVRPAGGHGGVGQGGDQRAGQGQDLRQPAHGDLLAEAGHLDGAAGQHGAVAARDQVTAPVHGHHVPEQG